MLINYDGRDIIVDKDINFVMINKCYQNGCNCYNCAERIFDGCIIDEINIDEINIEEI